jgi:RNA polymerase sigma factor (sigma-70 family)
MTALAQDVQTEAQPNPENSTNLKLNNRSNEPLTEAQKQLVADHYAYALKFIGKKSNANGADKLIDAVTHALFRAARDYDPESGPFKPFVKTYAKQAVLDEHKERAEREEYRGVTEELNEDEEKAIEKSLHEFDIGDALEALDKLGGREAEMVRMRFLEGKTEEEIGKAVGIKDCKWVRTLINRSLKELKEIIQQT